MSQLYLQRFQYRSGIKSDCDLGWAIANEAMANTGNYGGEAVGVTHKMGYGTGWGGYCILEVTDPAAFARYQHFHMLNYAHLVDITFEPIYDLKAIPK